MKMSTLGLASSAVLLALMTNLGWAQSPPPAVGETKWLNPNELKPGPKQRESLTTNQIVRIKTLYVTFADVLDSSIEKWTDGFKYDLDIEQELRVWEAMAGAYRTFCSSRPLALSQKKDAMRVLLLRSGAPEEDVLKRLELKNLTVVDAKVIMRLYNLDATPIQVREKK
jgi:hypothetical protein